MSPDVHHHRSLRVVVDHARELDDILGSAIERLQRTAAANPCCGILVTREAAGEYVVAHDESVPYGLTHQRA
ncbi:hypothetical protein [Sinomonas sp. ASV322]|uniref:hypothetical protein n=1 Tax=Sinomonas sp. ASV322 TaxID=3041920 RepID=UPI0027DDB44D|nr:hypothetical protein [Sinomonas sp. ASV322]MDQ4503421.1 hypothetical protein [Sinomonas sp. ASV322]